MLVPSVSALTNGSALSYNNNASTQIPSIYYPYTGIFFPILVQYASGAYQVSVCELTSGSLAVYCNANLSSSFPNGQTCGHSSFCISWITN